MKKLIMLLVVSVVSFNAAAKWFWESPAEPIVQDSKELKCAFYDGDVVCIKKPIAHNCKYDEQGRFIENTGFYFNEFNALYKDTVDYLENGSIIFTSETTMGKIPTFHTIITYTKEKGLVFTDGDIGMSLDRTIEWFLMKIKAHQDLVCSL